MKTIQNSIKHKLGASFALLVALSSIGGLVSYFLMKNNAQQARIKGTISEVLYQLSEARKAEKDFLNFDWQTSSFLDSGTCHSLDVYKKSIANVNVLLVDLQKEPWIIKNDLNIQVATIYQTTKNYTIAFQKLANALKRRGFKDYGLEGNMRSYVHNLQDRIAPQEQVFAYMLRRHEKDFILRKDKSYIDKLHQTADAFKAFIINSNLPHMNEQYKAKSIRDITEYVRQFDKIVMIEEQIGLTNSSGIKGQLKSITDEVQPQADALFAVINQQSANGQQFSLLVLLVSLLLIIGIGIGLSIFLTRAISRPVIALDQVTQEVLKGNNNIETQLASITQQDEIGSLANNFKAMLGNLQENLIHINEKTQLLELKLAEDQKRNWAIEGLAAFVDVIKNINSDLELLANESIRFIVNYTKANQGAFFVLNDEKEPHVMELMGTYAYGRLKRKYLQLELGESLVGASWREKDLIYLTDIPQKYLTITSGLGNANPTSIIIMPVINENKVEAVIELASFKEFEIHEVDFIRAIAERLASIIAAVKMQQKSHDLLINTQELTEKLSANEEVMRQNMETMMANHEELSRTNASLQNKLNIMQKNAYQLDRIITKVYEGYVFIDESFKIIYTNSFLEHKLHFSNVQIQESNISQLLGMDIQYVIENLNNDLNYLVNDFTKEYSTFIKNADGATFDVQLTITKLNIDKQIIYALLFNKTSMSEARKYVKSIAEKRSVNTSKFNQRVYLS